MANKRQRKKQMKKQMKKLAQMKEMEQIKLIEVTPAAIEPVEVKDEYKA
jgi:hypothetical protein